MKTLMYFFGMVLIVFAGCAKDDPLFENQESLELKKAKVPIPFKLDAYVVHDMESDLVLIEGLDTWTQSRLICSGTATHVGKIDSEKSFYILEKLVLFFENGIPYTRNTGKGILVGANGDGIEFTFEIKQSALDLSFTGTSKLVSESGTGKFEGATGSINTVGGKHEDGVGLWTKNEGYIVYE
jgi:hypothetical protein